MLIRAAGAGMTPIDNAPQWVEATCLGCHRQISLELRDTRKGNQYQAATYQGACDRCKLTLQILYQSPPP
jgi:hypothetical protein